MYFVQTQKAVGMAMYEVKLLFADKRNLCVIHVPVYGQIGIVKNITFGCIILIHVW